MTRPAHRFLGLDALRGICAVMVCLFHFRVGSPISASPLVRSSWQFVDFFFVLSGFVIAANYSERLRDKEMRARFIGLRLARIYPLHVFTLALYVASEVTAALWFKGNTARAAFDNIHSPMAIVLNLLMLQSAGLTGGLTWNQPSWSIATEFWSYILYALAVARFGNRLDPVLLAVVVVCPLVLLAVTPLGINVTWNWGQVRCVYGFALGVLCWSAWRRWETPIASIHLWTLIETATLVGVGAFVVATSASAWNVLGPPLFAVAVLVFAHEGGGISRLLALPPMVLIGTLSYSIYMMHTYVQARLIDLLHAGERIGGFPLTATITHDGRGMTQVAANPVEGISITLAMLVVVFGVSWLTYHIVERPAQRWLRSLFQTASPHRSR